MAAFDGTDGFEAGAGLAAAAAAGALAPLLALDADALRHFAIHACASFFWAAIPALVGTDGFGVAAAAAAAGAFLVALGAGVLLSLIHISEPTRPY